jgi:flagellar hook-basal body complex protein FliE
MSLQGIRPVEHSGSEVARFAATGPSPRSFEKLVQGFLRQAQAAEQEANVAVEQLATSEAESVHQVMLAVARADLAFRLVMEVRDRLVQAYNDVLRMQV